METGVTVNYNYSLTSAIHFFNMLQEIEKSQFCSGAGMNNGRFLLSLFPCGVTNKINYEFYLFL